MVQRYNKYLIFQIYFNFLSLFFPKSWGRYDFYLDLMHPEHKFLLYLEVRSYYIFRPLAVLHYGLSVPLIGESCDVRTRPVEQYSYVFVFGL